MQFAVPQFTEVEDRLIGSLTLKQFLVLLAAGGIILFFWSILGPSIPFFVLAVPIGLLGIGAALGRYNGRPAFTYAMPFAAFLASSRTRIFKREPNTMMVSKSEVQTEVIHAMQKDKPTESTESRLKKLAYLLDSKEKEEQEIIGGDVQQTIQSPSKQQIDLTGFVKKAKSEIQSFAQTGVKPAAKTATPAQRPSAAKPSAPQKPKKFDPSAFLEK